MRVVIVAETYVPDINGVTNSVRHVAAELSRRGHDVSIVAPAPGPSRVDGVEVERVPGFQIPLYRQLSLGLPVREHLRTILAARRPDIVHVAAPAVLGAAGLHAAASVGVPAVAVFQTDLAGFARRYHLGVAGPAIWQWMRRIHELAELTLVPSTHSLWQLRQRGFGRLALWGRGVDFGRFDPAHRRPELRREWGVGPDRCAVGYVGRIAHEKRVELLRHVIGLRGTCVVVVGDGPARRSVAAQLPGALFTGFLTGARLSQALASLDVFVHTGAAETFCQSIQEALASGVPVVAPAAGGPMDLVRHGDNGFLYPADDPVLLRGAVRTLVEDPALRHAMGQRGAASVAGRSWPALVDELVGHYGDAVRHARRVPVAA